MGLFSGFFSRKSVAPGPPRDDVPFESLRRSPRNTRKPRMVVGDASADPAAPLDPTSASRARARRRLIGAVALALAAIVFVPMLFDRSPPSPPDDIALQIPDKDSPFEGRRGVPDPARGPLRATTPLATVPAPGGASTTTESTPPDGQGKVEPQVVPEPPAEPPVMLPRPAPKANEKASEKLSEKAAEKASPSTTAAEKPIDKPRPPSGASDDPRAIAALEGRTDPAPSSDTSGKTFAVQIAAFSAADKARGLRDQLVSNGLKSYTESVATPQGLRTRVRLGPFASREAADRARQKLKTMKLDGSVVAL